MFAKPSDLIPLDIPHKRWFPLDDEEDENVVEVVEVVCRCCHYISSHVPSRSRARSSMVVIYLAYNAS
jgi:hypothetical protein